MPDQIVGPRSGLGRGSPVPIRAGRTAAQVISDAHGHFAEAVRTGNVMMLDSDAITLASANATKSANGTAKFINGFYNPIGSGVDAEILRAKVATTSGTPAGPYFYNGLYLPGTLTSAETGTIRNARLAVSGRSAMKALVNVAIAVTPADTTAFQQLAVMGGPAAVVAGAGLYDKDDLVDGSIIVPPGWAFGILAAGAGTTHIVQSTMWWEEVERVDNG